MAQDWALILGASSGFGAACAIELARQGLDIAGVHLDRRATLPEAQRVQAEIQSLGRQALFFNLNAADEENRRKVLDELQQKAGEGRVRVLLHSLAFGTLRPYVGDEGVTSSQMTMTLEVMAHSLVWWAHDLVARKLMGRGGRIFAMTSEGSSRVWRTYGPVSAAKAALESHVRQLAVELAPLGITVNAIKAGVTDTPALRKIPGHEEMMAAALKRNPHGRLTTPQDVAQAIALLSRPESAWITGNVIACDGGEGLVA